MSKTKNLFVELHVLVAHAPSNLNRDDLGTPKTAMFGGYRRLRISSQCLKRTWRRSDTFRDALPTDQLGTRTKGLPQLVADELERRNVKLTEDEGRGLRALYSAFGRKKGASLGDVGEEGEGASGSDSDEKTAHLLFLLPEEVVSIAEFIALEKTRKVLAVSVKAGKKAPKPKPGKPKTTAAAEDASPGAEAEGKQEWKTDDEAMTTLRKSLEKHLQAVRGAVDVALFGRFLTSDEFRPMEAAMQVAHAIGTQKAEIEVDYFTAVDDLSGEAAAGHLGETEFGASVFYKYAACDTGLLVANLGRGAALAGAAQLASDEDVASESARASALATEALSALVAAAARTVPSGKKNGTVPQNPADYVEVVVRRDAPVSLANAFLKPVRPTDEEDVMDRSIHALRRQADRYDAGYGDTDVVARLVFSARQDPATELKGFASAPGAVKLRCDSLGALTSALASTLSKELASP